MEVAAHKVRRPAAASVSVASVALRSAASVSVASVALRSVEVHPGLSGCGASRGKKKHVRETKGGQRRWPALFKAGVAARAVGGGVGFARCHTAGGSWGGSPAGRCTYIWMKLRQETYICAY
jgi:hypothetical protein